MMKLYVYLKRGNSLIEEREFGITEMDNYDIVLNNGDIIPKSLINHVEIFARFFQTFKKLSLIEKCKLERYWWKNEGI